jgi:hypothetical protein
MEETMHKIFRGTCWFLLVLFPAALFAGDAQTAAMLSGRGTVRVNGALAPSSSVVYEGDKVVTGKDASVTITSKGRTIVLPEESSLAYIGKQVRLEDGRVLIASRPGTEARLGNLTISSARGVAKFQMRNQGKTMVLAALDGSLNVSDGLHRITLPSGKAMAFADESTANGGGAGAGAGAPAPAVQGGGIPDWVILAGVGATGGTLGGLAASGVIGGGQHVSPSEP